MRARDEERRRRPQTLLDWPHPVARYYVTFSPPASKQDPTAHWLAGILLIEMAVNLIANQMSASTSTWKSACMLTMWPPRHSEQRMAASDSPRSRLVFISARSTMASLKLSLLTVNLLLILCRGEELTVDYYKETCPLLERMIRDEMAKKQSRSPTTAGAVLRIFFHDCFVEGCDASVLIASTPDNKAERDADINRSLPGDGFDAVNIAKAAVEKACPGVVSCADVLAIITRDLVGLVGGPFWEVRKGRKDGLISKASLVGSNIPTGDATVDQLTQLFVSKGLTQVDLLALSGGHSIGFAHCVEFMGRIRNFNGSSAADPSMHPGLARRLQQACPVTNLNPDVVATFDPTTPFGFDNAYYGNLKRGLGLLSSDQGLFTDERTRPLVEAFATRQDLFFEVFAASMDKLGRIGVKNSSQGVVRKVCHIA